MPASDVMRLDKWLWAARFFKTRALAVEAINGGKIQVGGQRAKPGREVRLGAIVSIHKGTQAWEVEVRGLSMQRGPAPVAVLLYQETAASVAHRAQLAAAKAEGLWSDPDPGSRPNKQQRRQLLQIKQFSSS